MEKVVLTVIIIGFGKVVPNVGKIANHTVSHKNNALVIQPKSIPISILFLRNIQTHNTINSFPIMMTGIIRGIMFIIGVAPIKYATTGVNMAIKEPEKSPQYKVAITNIQFTAEPVRYTDMPFKLWNTMHKASSKAVAVSCIVENRFFILLGASCISDDI